MTDIPDAAGDLLTAAALIRYIAKTMGPLTDPADYPAPDSLPDITRAEIPGVLHALQLLGGMLAVNVAHRDGTTVDQVIDEIVRRAVDAGAPGNGDTT